MLRDRARAFTQRQMQSDESLRRQIDERIGDDLANHGFSVVSDFLNAETASELRADFLSLHRQGEFRAAGVGQGTHHRKADDIRRDEVLWFESTQLSPAQATLWQRLDEVRQSLNRTLQLGLWSLEGHYAIYSPGGFYRRHLDRFRTDDARTISAVLYLNENWQPGDGGELKIYVTSKDNQEREIIVEPSAGTLVCFLSDEIEHEVMPAQKTRLSFAGWFKRRTNAI